MSNKKATVDSELTLEHLRAECELKTKWLSLIAHDFKGLFSNMKMMLDMLENKSISQDMFMSMLPEIRRINDKNTKTLESTFAWVNSQTEGFSPYIEDVQIHELFLELKDEFSDYIRLKEVSVQFVGDHDLSLSTDRFLIKFILKMILENAIKYSNKEGSIELIAHSNSQSNDVNITIKDSGVGMKESIIDDIGSFNGSPYTGTLQEKGAGLSLVIVKEFVVQLNGRMGISSIPDKWTDVELIFPLMLHD